MGLLDDAIREHLDLKRRRGADPADVERAEREALGPVRRAPTSQSVEVADEQHPETGFAYDHEDELGWSGDPRDAPERAPGTIARDRRLEADFDDESFAEPEVRAEPEQRPSRLARIFGRADPEPEPRPEEPEFNEPEFHEPEIERTGFVRRVDAPPPGRAARPSEPLAPKESVDSPEEPESLRSTPPPRPAAGLDDETAQYDVAPGLDPPPATSDEDVLEETPEFLQDTPDHDRLWFEQRPPKDFDFDG